MFEQTYSSELSAQGAKRDVDNTKKCTLPNCILAPLSHPRPCRPSDDDDDDNDDACWKCITGASSWLESSLWGIFPLHTLEKPLHCTSAQPQCVLYLWFCFFMSFALCFYVFWLWYLGFSACFFFCSSCSFKTILRTRKASTRILMTWDELLWTNMNFSRSTRTKRQIDKKAGRKKDEKTTNRTQKTSRRPQMNF